MTIEGYLGQTPVLINEAYLGDTLLEGMYIGDWNLVSGPYYPYQIDFRESAIHWYMGDEPSTRDAQGLVDEVATRWHNIAINADTASGFTYATRATTTNALWETHVYGEYSIDENNYGSFYALTAVNASEVFGDFWGEVWVDSVETSSYSGGGSLQIGEGYLTDLAVFYTVDWSDTLSVIVAAYDLDGDTALYKTFGIDSGTFVSTAYFDTTFLYNEDSPEPTDRFVGHYITNEPSDMTTIDGLATTLFGYEGDPAIDTDA